MIPLSTFSEELVFGFSPRRELSPIFEQNNKWYCMRPLSFFLNLNRVIKMKKQFERIIERYMQYMTAAWKNRKMYYPDVD